jgi:hypothetical protein
MQPKKHLKLAMPLFFLLLLVGVSVYYGIKNLPPEECIIPKRPLIDSMLIPVNENGIGYHTDLDGNRIYDENYEYVDNFYYGRARVKIAEQDWIFIDTDGNPLFGEHFVYMTPHNEGIAIVQRKDQDPFYMDLEGNRIHEESYPFVGGFNECRGDVTARNETGDGYYMFHINQKGERVYKENYKSVRCYSYGFAAVMDMDGNAFHIDRKGRRLYKENYHSAEPFIEGFAIVSVEGPPSWTYHYCIDTNGNVVKDISGDYVIGKCGD